MLPVYFFLIALFYSMVGFGGGSSYIALLALMGMPYQTIPPIALVCNLIVVVGGCWHFYRAGYLKLKLILPFVLLSIPMAYLGGRIPISNTAFCFVLGFSLLCVAIRMFVPDKWFENPKEISWKAAWFLGVPMGGFLGFLAGLVGIGGGILLSPLLLFLRWGHVKEVAATASFFILVNSASGLLGQMQKGGADFSLLLPLAVAVFLGGQIGSRLGAYQLPKLRLQQLLALLVLYISVRLIGIAI